VGSALLGPETPRRPAAPRREPPIDGAPVAARLKLQHRLQPAAIAESSLNNMTSLARALSQPTLNLTEVADVSPQRNTMRHSCRRRKLSSCNSLECEELATSPSATEARVLVLNTGGTIGMTLHNNGIYIYIYIYLATWPRNGACVPS